MPKYSQNLKDKMLNEMMPPNNKSVAELSKEHGLSEQTLYNWKRQAKEKGMVIPKTNTSSENWAPKDKFHVVVETATLSEIELSEYCRSKGLYVEQVIAWRDACMQANGGVAEETATLQRNLRDKDKAYKQLEKELNRKEKALAETAALLVLQKKCRAIWGETEDE